MPQHSRRGFLRRTLGACWTGAALLEQSVIRAAQARAQSAGAPNQLFRIQKVADGVYAAVARPEVLLNSNAAIFENARDLLVVDTHSKPSAVAGLLAQIRSEITEKPVRYVVNSHFHWDHTQGTPAYRKLQPQPDVIASEATRRLLSENGAARLKASVETAAAAIDAYQKQADAAATRELRAFWQRNVTDTKAYIAEMRGYAPELPNVTLERDLILHDAAHDLHLMFRGRGHTAGDILVYCPQKKVIATGDLLHGFFPYIADGYPTEWPGTLLEAAQFPFAHAIGGHGGVQQGKERLYQMSSYIEELTEAVKTGKRQGKSIEQLQTEITPQRLKSLDRAGYGLFLRESLSQHRLMPPDANPNSAVALGVSGNIADIYRNVERS
jgi:glyoxylase-like metal-dependent hydrolase (beta-lactamase superfamily II)